ncbi:CRISPR system precrRNA processing endoribonuclease RAMP protein Cas6 [Pasteurella sp. P03HT]
MDVISFPIARYQFHFQVTQPIALPEYAGSTIRGVFGRALRKISCMTKLADCKSCPLYRTCPYTNIFETPAPESHNIQKFSQIPNGYIIEPPEWGEKIYPIGTILKFELVLFGQLIQQLPLISFAFKRAFEFNIAGGQAELVDIHHYSQNRRSYSIFEKNKIEDHQAEIILLEQYPTSIQLDIQTPLRLQKNGKALSTTKISLERFLKTLLKRIALLSEFHHQPLDIDFEQLISQIENIQDEKTLTWKDWTRYSSRQQQTMKLGGVVGQWNLHNVPPEWAKLLYIGQWLHCGKNATFGLGKYQIANL